MTITKTAATFKATPTLANAKKLVAHVAKHPMTVCMMSADDMAAHTQAQRIVADAKNPAKTKEAMQRELKARFPGMNIEVN